MAGATAITPSILVSRLQEREPGRLWGSGRRRPRREAVNGENQTGAGGNGKKEGELGRGQAPTTAPGHPVSVMLPPPSTLASVFLVR